jgi:hypothetical protein
MTALDSALAAANPLYETLQSSGQQVVEVTRSNLDMAAATRKAPNAQAIRHHRRRSSNA